MSNLRQYGTHRTKLAKNIQFNKFKPRKTMNNLTKKFFILTYLALRTRRGYEILVKISIFVEKKFIA